MIKVYLCVYIRESVYRSLRFKFLSVYIRRTLCELCAGQRKAYIRRLEVTEDECITDKNTIPFIKWESGKFFEKTELDTVHKVSFCYG